MDFSVPLKSLGNWFTEEHVNGKRAAIARLIKRLARQQNPGHNFNFPTLGFGEAENEREEEEDEGEEEEEETEVEEKEKKSPSDHLKVNSTKIKITLKPKTLANVRSSNEKSDLNI